MGICAHGIEFINSCVGSIVVAAIHVFQGDIPPIIKSTDLGECDHCSKKSPEVELIVLFEEEDTRDREVEEHQKHHANDIEKRSEGGSNAQHDNLKVADP